MGLAVAFRVVLWGAALFSLALGLWLVQRPKKAIEMQMAFYRHINWRMEPMDWSREIRNTRIMGMTALLCAVLTAALLLTGAGAARAAEETSPEWAPPKVSAELESIKSLAGTWTGASREKDGQSNPVTITYELTAGGSAVVEKIDPGTAHEMVSMYHDKNGRLSMTHYCMMGNQPQLDLKSSAGGKIELAMTPENLAALGGQAHMHALILQSTGDALTQTWTAMGTDGKPMEPTVFRLRRSA